jgi:sigma-54 dependent transcriptional regulator, acetoin dehydrogenase operon transcriptional activator AcoR
MLYDEHKTMDAWADFLGGGSASERRQSVVRSVIQNSWRRSLEGGIDANGTAAPVHGDREKIDDLIRKNADLIAGARPCFAAVPKMVEGTGRDDRADRLRRRALGSAWGQGDIAERD